MEAMTKTLHAYEKVIEAWEWSKDDWHEYPINCRICNVFRNKYGYRDCSKCPLDNCCDVTYHKLYETIFYYGHIYNIKPFKDRYEWLIAKIEKAGYEYK